VKEFKMSEELYEVPDSSEQDRRSMMILLGVLAGIAAIVIVLLVIVLVFDPFGWDLLGRGKIEAVAGAMPSDVAFYIGLNLGNVECEDVDPIVRALSPELQQKEGCVLDDLDESLEDFFQSEFGISYVEEVEPWLGESIAIGVGEMEMGLYGELEDIELILAVEVTDPSAAEDFLDVILEDLSMEMGEEILEEPYQETTLYYVEGQQEMPAFTFALSEDMLIFGVGKNDVKGAIDAQHSDSLADTSSFRDMMAELPANRIMTFFMDSEQYMGMFSSLLEDFYDPSLSDTYTEAFSEMPYAAGALSFADVGIRLDTVTVIDREGEQAQAMADQFPGLEPLTQALMPDDTFLYFVGAGLNSGVDALRDNLGTALGMGDIEESLMFFEMAFGFDPFEDFLAKLDGEWALGLMHSAEGYLVEELNAPIGFALVAGTSDPDGILEAAESLSMSLEGQGVGSVERMEGEKTTLFELVDLYTGELVLAYGVGEGYFVLGSSAGTIESLFEGGASLADNERYEEVWKAFPRDMRPVLYFDIQGLIANIRETIPAAALEDFEEELGQGLNALQHLAIAGSALEDGIVRATMILFVETD
jgi:hypothetical protein